MTRRNTLAQTFAAPLAIAAATGIGLAAGLIGDAVWDAAAWLGLTVPVAASAGAWRHTRAGRRGTRMRAVSGWMPREDSNLN